MQLFVCFGPCHTYCTALSIWNSCCEDGVGVIIVEDEDIFISAAGCDWKTTSLIGVGSGEFFVVDEGEKSIMRSRVGWFLCWRKIESGCIYVGFGFGRV